MKYSKSIVPQEFDHLLEEFNWHELKAGLCSQPGV